MAKKKAALDITKVILDFSKNIARISQTQMHFKDILSALVDMAQKTDTNMQVMNQKYKQIRDQLQDLEKPIMETNKNVNTIVTQLDYKERAELVKGKLNAGKVIAGLIGAIKAFFMNSKYILAILVIILAIIAWMLGANKEKIGQWIIEHLPF